MKTLGTLLMVVGGVVLLWAMFIFDTSVDVSGYGRRIVNLGLMDDCSTSACVRQIGVLD